MSLDTKGRVQGDAKSVALAEVLLECMIYMFAEDALGNMQGSLDLRNILE